MWLNPIDCSEEACPPPCELVKKCDELDAQTDVEGQAVRSWDRVACIPSEGWGYDEFPLMPPSYTAPVKSYIKEDDGRYKWSGYRAVKKYSPPKWLAEHGSPVDFQAWLSLDACKSMYEKKVIKKFKLPTTTFPGRQWIDDHDDGARVDRSPKLTPFEKCSRSYDNDVCKRFDRPDLEGEQFVDYCNDSPNIIEDCENKSYTFCQTLPRGTVFSTDGNRIPMDDHCVTAISTTKYDVINKRRIPFPTTAMARPIDY